MTIVALGYWSDFFSGAMVSEVTAAKQREFIAWLKDRRKPRKSDGPVKVQLSDGYIKRILNIGKAALNHAYKEGEIESVPYIFPGEDGPAKDRILTQDESKALWAAAKQPHELMFLAIAYGTMSRPEAITEITLEMSDLKRGLLNTNPPGRKQTKKYRPVVPICEFLRPWLDNAEPGPLVTWQGKPIESFKTAFRRMRRDAGLGPDVVAKTIRYTVASELRAMDVPDAEIQGMLGHRAYAGKTEVYAKYRPGYLGKACEAIDEYMKSLRVSCVLVSTPNLWPVSVKAF